MSHEMVPCLVSWAADAVIECRTMDNGRTAYEDITGHGVKHVVATC